MPPTPAVQRVLFYGGLAAAVAMATRYSTSMPGKSLSGALPAPTGTMEGIARELAMHVSTLAGTIGERNTGEEKSLERARDYIAAQLHHLPAPSSASIEIESIGPEGLDAENVIFELPGQTSELVVVGAHYDSAPGTPGANDNATGVAVGLVLARRAVTQSYRHRLRFVFFANEEPHFFQNPGMGSLAHARGCRSRGEHIRAMLSLESLGYYSDEPKSQHYPWPIGLLYPDRGNFVAFVGNFSSRWLVRESIGTFRAAGTFPSEGAALPGWIAGVGWSDHWSFWQYNYPAIMVTDTAVYRDPNYHQPSDVVSNPSYEPMARVTLGLLEVITHLADMD
ncbi:MAG TPA: M28 family peptidase [Polyangiaceae bacterium]|nr:M28 family peptidase [Polyangiaceae bacterium]